MLSYELNFFLSVYVMQSEHQYLTGNFFVISQVIYPLLFVSTNPFALHYTAFHQEKFP